MAIDVKSFGGFLPAATGDEAPVAYLVDRHSDWMGEKNRLLYHPGLVDRTEGEPEPYLRVGRIPEWDSRFIDPLGPSDPRFRGEWVVASHEVRLAGERPGAPSRADRGTSRAPWVVLVEQRRDVVFWPVEMLRDRLQAFYLAGLAGVGLLLASLSGFLLLAPTGAIRTRWHRFLRRRAGLSSQSGLGPSSRPSATREEHRGGPRPSDSRPAPTQPDTAAFPSVAVPWTIAATLARARERACEEEEEPPGGLAPLIPPVPGRAAGGCGVPPDERAGGVDGVREHSGGAPPTI